MTYAYKTSIAILCNLCNYTAFYHSIGPKIDTPSIRFLLEPQKYSPVMLYIFVIFAFFCIPMSDISRRKLRIFSLFFLIWEILLLPTPYVSATTDLEIFV